MEGGCFLLTYDQEGRVRREAGVGGIEQTDMSLTFTFLNLYSFFCKMRLINTTFPDCPREYKNISETCS